MIATTTEEDSSKTFDQLVADKTKEIEARTASIEDNISAVDNLCVQIVQMNEDRSDHVGDPWQDFRLREGLECLPASMMQLRQKKIISRVLISCGCQDQRN